MIENMNSNDELITNLPQYMHKETTIVTRINWDWGKATKYPIKTIAFLGFLDTNYFLMTQHCISLVQCIRRKNIETWTFLNTGRSNFGAFFHH